MERKRIGSLFDGSGTAPLAAAMLGWEPVWASEIEPYPVAVTRARFPHMQHLGDITKINGAEIPPVDVIVGGSPCQDLSVAGKQAGLEGGTRSNLFYEMTRIVREMRSATDGKYPRFVVWENVPGAFSSNKGRDFHEVVKAFCAVADDSVHIPEPEKDRKTDRLIWKNAGAVVGDGWSFGWRVLDAQYWGVPQRRRRIFAVLDLGSERAGEILFERTRLPWDSEPRGAEGEGTPADAVGCADRGDGVRHLQPVTPFTNRGCETDDVTETLRAQSHGAIPMVAYTDGVVGAFCAGAAPAAGSIGYSEQVAPTLKSAQCAFPMGAVVYPVGAVGSLCARADSSPCIDRGQPFVAMFSGGQGDKAGGIGYSERVAPTLKSAQCAFPMGAVVYPIHDKATRHKGGGQTRNNDGSGNGLGVGRADDPMYTATAADRHAVVYDARGNGNGDVAATITGDHQNRITDYTNITCYQNTGRGWWNGGDTAQTLRTPCGGDSTKANVIVEKRRRYVVCRLTPLECARLQGFPDWWTDGVEGSDSAKYKMWGNGMALPCALAVLNGVNESEKTQRRTCPTCAHHLGAGCCRANLEKECGDGGYEAWQPKTKS